MTLHFEQLRNGAPHAEYEFTLTGELSSVKIIEMNHGKAILFDGRGVMVSSNNPAVVPNAEGVFQGKMGLENQRIIEFYGRAPGKAMIEAKQPLGETFDNSTGAPGVMASETFARLQVVVLPRPVDKLSNRIALASPSVALNAAHVPGPYQLTHSFTVQPGTKVKDVLALIPAGAKHLVFACHGAPGFLNIGEGITSKDLPAFSGLSASRGMLVIWLTACAVAGNLEGDSFCEAMAKTSGCHVVGAAMSVPVVKTSPGQIDIMIRSMPHYRDPQGKAIKEADFFQNHKMLGFTVV